MSFKWSHVFTTSNCLKLYCDTVINQWVLLMFVFTPKHLCHCHKHNEATLHSIFSILLSQIDCTKHLLRVLNDIPQLCKNTYYENYPVFNNCFVVNYIAIYYDSCWVDMFDIVTSLEESWPWLSPLQKEHSLQSTLGNI